MKLQEFKEVKEMTVPELLAKEHELRQSLFNLRMQSRVGQVQQPSQLRQLRKDIARVLTVVNQKKQIEASAAKAPGKQPEKQKEAAVKK